MMFEKKFKLVFMFNEKHNEVAIITDLSKTLQHLS